MLRFCRILLVLLPILTVVAPAHASQFAIWTDKPAYYIGETITIHIEPVPALGVTYWLIIQKPDGSQTREDLSPGQGAVTSLAGPPPGQRRVELWGQAVSPSATPELYADCYYEVREHAAPTQFRIWAEKQVYYYGDTVTIHIQPAPGVGVSYWLVIQRPDGSQTRADLGAGQDVVTAVAGPPPGQRSVELWGHVVAPSTTPERYAECAYNVREKEIPTQFTIWTDKPVYYYGETITIHIQPTPAVGVNYWLIIQKPHGSQDRLDLSRGQGTATAVAGPPYGQYRVELWGQVVATDTAPQLFTNYNFGVKEPPSVAPVTTATYRTTETQLTKLTSTTTQTVASTVTETAAGRCLLRTGETCVLGCVLATAAYGSEMAPEVVYMRHVRDDLIGSTAAGKMLIAGFNAFYYSWSPTVAQTIAGNELLRVAFRILLTPLVWIVHATALVFSVMTNIAGRPDAASVIAFLAAALMTIAVYIVFPAFAGTKLIQAIRRHSVAREPHRRA